MILRPSFSPTTLVRRFSLPFALGVVALLLLQVVDVVRVTGNSMNPTLQENQLLLRFKHPTNYQRGDIVIVHSPRALPTKPSRFIKRLIALPGDTVSIQNDQVYLNDQVLSELYISASATRAEFFPEVLVAKGEVVAFEGFALAELPEYLHETLEMLEPLPQEVLGQSYAEPVSYIGKIKLAQDFYFVLGDNRAFSASEDSRLFGAVSEQNILGVVNIF